MKLWRALPSEGRGAPGTVLQADDRLVVACGDTALALQQLQRPGGRRVSVREFLAGSPVLRPGLQLVSKPGNEH